MVKNAHVNSQYDISLPKDRPFAFCVRPKHPLNRAYQEGVYPHAVILLLYSYFVFLHWTNILSTTPWQVSWCDHDGILPLPHRYAEGHRSPLPAQVPAHRPRDSRRGAPSSRLRHAHDRQVSPRHYNMLIDDVTGLKSFRPVNDIKKFASAENV